MSVSSKRNRQGQSQSNFLSQQTPPVFGSLMIPGATVTQGNKTKLQRRLNKVITVDLELMPEELWLELHEAISESDYHHLWSVGNPGGNGRLVALQDSNASERDVCYFELQDDWVSSCGVQIEKRLFHEVLDATDAPLCIYLDSYDVQLDTREEGDGNNEPQYEVHVIQAAIKAKEHKVRGVGQSLPILFSLSSTRVSDREENKRLGVVDKNFVPLKCWDEFGFLLFKLLDSFKLKNVLLVHEGEEGRAPSGGQSVFNVLVEGNNGMKVDQVKCRVHKAKRIRLKGPKSVGDAKVAAMEATRHNPDQSIEVLRNLGLSSLADVAVAKDNLGAFGGTTETTSPVEGIWSLMSSGLVPITWNGLLARVGGIILHAIKNLRRDGLKWVMCSPPLEAGGPMVEKTTTVTARYHPLVPGGSPMKPRTKSRLETDEKRNRRLEGRKSKLLKDFVSAELRRLYRRAANEVECESPFRAVRENIEGLQDLEARMNAFVDLDIQEMEVVLRDQSQGRNRKRRAVTNIEEGAESRKKSRSDLRVQEVPEVLALEGASARSDDGADGDDMLDVESGDAGPLFSLADHMDKAPHAPSLGDLTVDPQVFDAGSDLREQMRTNGDAINSLDMSQFSFYEVPRDGSCGWHCIGAALGIPAWILRVWAVRALDFAFECGFPAQRPDQRSSILNVHSGNSLTTDSLARAPQALMKNTTLELKAPVEGYMEEVDLGLMAGVLTIGFIVVDSNSNGGSLVLLLKEQFALSPCAT